MFNKIRAILNAPSRISEAELEIARLHDKLNINIESILSIMKSRLIADMIDTCKNCKKGIGKPEIEKDIKPTKVSKELSKRKKGRVIRKGNPVLH